MRLFVTGARGFIGSAFSTAAEAAGHEVVPYDIADGLDLLYPTTVRTAIKGCDAAVHLAGRIREGASWENPPAYWRDNALASAILFEEARRAGAKVLHMSTSALGPILSERGNVLYDYATPYASSKMAAEVALLEQTRHYKGFKATIYRLHNIYGPGQPEDFVIPKFIHAAFNRQPITVARNVRDYVHIDDVVRTLLQTIEEDRWGLFGEIGTGIGTTDAELAYTVMEAVGVAPYAITITDAEPTTRQATINVVSNPIPLLDGIRTML